MDDSMINPNLLSSSTYLENVEQVIKNLEKQTFNLGNFENILSNNDKSLSINSDTPANIDKSKSHRQKSKSVYSDDIIVSNIVNHMNNPSSSSSQQQIPNNNNNNNSSGSSTTSSSTSWRQMKESQRIITGIETKETRSLSPFNLYKNFQQKSNISSSRNTFQLNRQKNDQAIQTTLTTASKSKSYNPLTASPSTSTASLHKSLPDLSFVSQYAKELPRSLTTSPFSPTSSSSINITRTTPSPILIHQQKQDSDRPRTLKSIKRYKNSKHSTEPLDVFYSPQLRKISTTRPTSSQSVQKHHSQDDLSKHLLSPCKSSNDHLSSLTKHYGGIRRCQTDIIVVDPILHHHSFTDSPPNEFCLQRDEEDDDDEILMEKSHISDQSMNIDLLDRINDIVKRLFEIKRSNKTFLLNNEHNLQLDSLLKNDLCSAIQNILEHGRKDLKKITLWKIIQISIEQNLSCSQPIYQAKQIAQNISSNWLYKFQAFIFALLNKNELINWLYYFTRQKELLHRYYQSPDALILVSISSTFNLFERIMTQLEKLTSLPFQLTYHPPSNDDQFNTSIITKDWIMTLSRRTTKNFPQPIHSNDTFRSTLSRKLTAIFTKTKTSSVVTPKLPGSIHSVEQDFIPRPSLNVDKPKSVRYRSSTLPLK